MLNIQEPTHQSLRYREVAVQAWSEVIAPHLRTHRPDLIESIFFAVGSSVAYGLADEHSDIDLLLILPVEEFSARESEWFGWAFNNPGLTDLAQRTGVPAIGVKVSTWQREGLGILFGGKGSWDDLYNDHLHWMSSLIPIHDPRDQMDVIRQSLTRVPQGLAERAVARYAGQLADIWCGLHRLHKPEQDRFIGLLGYSIALRALPLLFHRENVPPPFHKWQWPLAERLSEDSRMVLKQLRAMLEVQMGGVFSLPDGLVGSDVKQIPSRMPPLAVGVVLSLDEMKQALLSVQWHLDERGCYQMVRARMRGWREAALMYMCATRCLLIKGAILLETGRIACGEDVSLMWEQVREWVPGLEECLWPEPGEDPFDSTLRGIDVFRQRLSDRQALPQQYLENPLSSPPSYELACMLEEL